MSHIHAPFFTFAYRCPTYRVRACAEYAVPADAVNHGNTFNECHVPGMNYPASFLNVNRNQAILAAMAL